MCEKLDREEIQFCKIQEPRSSTVSAAGGDEEVKFAERTVLLQSSDTSFHGSTLPSFLFRMLQDRDVDPSEVNLVPDNAAAVMPNHTSSSSSSFLRQTISAPCLYHTRSPPSLTWKGSFATNSGFQQGAPAAFLDKANARWSPMVSVVSPSSNRPSTTTSRSRVKSATVRALLIETETKTKTMTGEGKKESRSSQRKKATTNEKSGRLPNTTGGGGSTRGRSSHLTMITSLAPLHEEYRGRERTATTGSTIRCQSTTTTTTATGSSITCSTDSLLELIKPRRRASPTPTTTTTSAMLRRASRNSDVAAIHSDGQSTLLPSSRSLPYLEERQKTKERTSARGNELWVM